MSRAGADSVTFHVEAAQAPEQLARDLRSMNARAGIALRPDTPLEPYEDLLGEIDMLLLMTVEPGFGGQRFLNSVVPKVRYARSLIAKHRLPLWLQVDGGISMDTIGECADGGADVYVAGTAIFNADEPNKMVDDLRAEAILAGKP
jgi:ribulose-phosphate 3-epimerase